MIVAPSLARERQHRKLPAPLVVAFALAVGCPTLSLAQLFSEVTTQVHFVSLLRHSWGNPIWGDFDNDGFLDLIVPTHGLAKSHGPFVYLNNAGITFTDIRATCGITQSGDLDYGDWHGYALGDYDGDGFLDLYVAEGSNKGDTIKSDLLFKGGADATFSYVSPAAGIIESTDRGRCGFWVDYDNDGQLDLFVKNYVNVNRLYKNTGAGTFIEVGAQSGLDLATLGKDYGTICSFADYDNDGFMDVAFSGDSTTESLYRNKGDGTFIDVTRRAHFLRHPPYGKGIAWGDYNNDGFVDLYIARGTVGSENFSNTLYRNNGDGTFTDVSTAAGVAAATGTWAAVWGDYDNDGWLDLFVTSAAPWLGGVNNANLLYHNNGDGTFTDRALAEGVQLQDNVSLHKCAAWADYDNDGFLDLIVKDGIGGEKATGDGAEGLHRLFRNAGNGNHFLILKLAGTQSNSNGIGARVTVTYEGNTCYRQNNGGGGGEYASQGSEPLHVGLGTATEATVVVHWPSGIVDTIPSLAANSRLTIVEGAWP